MLFIIKTSNNEFIVNLPINEILNNSGYNEYILCSGDEEDKCNLAELKNRLGIVSKPKILGRINKETEFVLNYFNIEVPEYLEDVKVQIKDIK